MDFWKRFKSLCNINNIRPTAALKNMGISPGNMKRWESGASITAETLEKIMDYFNVPSGYFFGECDINGVNDASLNKHREIEDLFHRKIYEQVYPPKDWTLERYEILEEYREIDIHFAYHPMNTVCPRCGASASRKHDDEIETIPIKIGTMMGLDVCVRYIRPLVLCNKCGIQEIVRG